MAQILAERRQSDMKMNTLVIHAPYSKGPPSTPTSFETYLRTGI